MNVTICAPVTGNTQSAVAIVRLSGPESPAILREITKREHFLPRQQTYCALLDGDTVLDRALVTYFEAPNSFTGEDIVEFAVHGSAYIKGRLLELLCQYGATPAKPGEFSLRAFLNGKMDLVQAQGLCDLIASSSKSAHALAMNSLDGKLSRKFEEIKETLTELLAQIEVRLDDVDEEMEPLNTTFALSDLESVTAQITALADTFRIGKIIKDGVKVAIVGAPNCGKSSLLNALVGFDRAIVADTCGTTRDTIEEVLDVGGQKVILTDTAGIREHALDPAEQEGMRRSMRAIEQADLVLFVTDITRKLSTEEKELWNSLEKGGKKVLLVLNKADATEQPQCELSERTQIKNCVISCITGYGIERLSAAIAELAGTKDKQEDGLLITNLRQYEALIKAQTELESAALRISEQSGLEIYAEHIRTALRYLKDIIGEVTPDDVLGVIFSKFCMGK